MNILFLKIFKNTYIYKMKLLRLIIFVFICILIIYYVILPIINYIITNKTITQTPITTTYTVVTTTPIITTPIITPIPRTIIFSAGPGGNFFDSNGGGGGAGGIIINVVKTINGDRGMNGGYQLKGGVGGIGYGAGGGGAGSNSTTSYVLNGGKGTQGFVYIVEEDRLFTQDINDYIPSNTGTYTFILVGGGGCGGPGDLSNINSGNGGDAGQIVINKIKGILNNTKLNITIGTGGYYSQDNIPQKGSDTIVSCTLSGGSKVTLTAFGAYPGNKGDKDNTQIYKSFSNGGKIGKSGNSVDINIINNMNSSFPTII